MRCIGTVGESLGDTLQTFVTRQLNQLGAGQRHQYQSGIDGADGGDHRQRLAAVVGNGVVQGAVGLHIAHRGARSLG
ncbi:hypothetical protein D9M71_767400 [compost metagenome]